MGFGDIKTNAGVDWFHIATMFKSKVRGWIGKQRVRINYNALDHQPDASYVIYDLRRQTLTSQIVALFVVMIRIC